MSGPPVAITFYTKSRCPLCAAAAEVLGEVGRRVPVTLTTVDVMSDTRAFARYAEDIPVVVVDGHEFRHRITVDEVLLAAAAARGQR